VTRYEKWKTASVASLSVGALSQLSDALQSAIFAFSSFHPGKCNYLFLTSKNQKPTFKNVINWIRWCRRFQICPKNDFGTVRDGANKLPNFQRCKIPHFVSFGEWLLKCNSFEVCILVLNCPKIIFLTYFELLFSLEKYK